MKSNVGLKKPSYHDHHMGYGKGSESTLEQVWEIVRCIIDTGKLSKEKGRQLHMMGSVFYIFK